MRIKGPIDIYITQHRNTIFGDMRGAQVSRISNKFIGNMDGVQAAVFENVVWGRMKGLQLALLTNDADSFKGVQLSLLMNVCRDSDTAESTGVQAGLFNMRLGEHVRWYAKAIPLIAVRRPLGKKPVQSMQSPEAKAEISYKEK